MPNRKERRAEKARERLLPEFSRTTRLHYIKQIQTKERKEAIKNKIAKSIARRLARQNKNEPTNNSTS